MEGFFMSKELKTSGGEASSSETPLENQPETTRELFTRLTLNDPQFIIVKPSGRAFELPMGKPSAKH
jgi:hypothetical protein